jgi:hypothetical protein
MKYALALIALVTVLAFAGGEFGTGCAEMFKISGYNKAWIYMWGQDYADPDMSFRAYNWTAFQANLNDWVSGGVGLEFNSYSGNIDLQVCDAWLMGQLAPEFSLKAGQFKVPFGHAFTCSGGGIYFLDRAALASTMDFGYYGGRDIGLNAHAQFDMVGIDLGLYNGNGAYMDSDTTTNMQFVAGVTLDAADWMTFGAGVSMIGQPELTDSGVVVQDSWSGTGIDAYLLVNYPVSETADLVFEGEYLNAGWAGPDYDGFTEEAGSDFYAMLGVKIGLEGFLSAIMPAVRYESLDPMELVADGGTNAEDKTTVIDFCLNFYNGDNHDIQLGGRNWGFENDNIDGYTDMYLGWRMRF